MKLLIYFQFWLAWIIVVQLDVARGQVELDLHSHDPGHRLQPDPTVDEPGDLVRRAESATPKRIVGRNPTGELEYSVLEGPLPYLHVQTSLPEDSASGQLPSPRSHDLNSWLTKLVLAYLPHEYIQDKKWGGQTRQWAGIALRRDTPQSKLETNRRYKTVNHGDWQKYSAKLVDPQNQFSVTLLDVRQTGNGKTAYDLQFAADLQLEARQTKWVKGVQVYSFSAEGSAQVQLLLSLLLDVVPDLSRLPPDLILVPVVTDAKIEIVEFRLNRVSKVGGEVAQQVSRLARRELQTQIQAKEQKLVHKLNQEIDDNRHRLRLSIAEAVRLQWFDKSEPFLPQEVKQAIYSESSQAKHSPHPARELDHSPPNLR